jgi:ubiquinone/menaquinone biosynthesis C-methylase UbiE
VQRPDKTANQAFYEGQRDERRRFDVRPEKLHAVERFVSWAVPYLRAGDRVLDVAGGAGTYASQIVRAVPVTIVGLDIAEAMVRQRALDPLLQLNVVADMEALPFADESFDAVMFVAALHHVPEPLRALQEANRVLRPGGRLFALEPSSVRASGKGTRPVPGMAHEFAVSAWWLAAQMREAGFEVEHVRMRNLAVRVLALAARRSSLALFHAGDALDRVLARVPGLDRFAETGLLQAVKPGPRRSAGR